VHCAARSGCTQTVAVALVKPIVISCQKKSLKKKSRKKTKKKHIKKQTKKSQKTTKESTKNLTKKKQNCTDAWVTRPERLKGVKDVIKQARRAAA